MQRRTFKEIASDYSDCVEEGRKLQMEFINAGGYMSEDLQLRIDINDENTEMYRRELDDLRENTPEQYFKEKEL